MTPRMTRLDDDVWEYLKKHSTFEDTPSEVIRRLVGFQKPPISSPPHGRSGVLKSDRDYTAAQISGYEFEGAHVSVRTFKDALSGICDTLRKTHGPAFDAIALPLRGRKRRYFSRTNADLKHPRRLEWNGQVGAELYVESNMNANSIVGLCRHLIQKLGHDVSTFKIR